jgi:hypothetical protein
MTIKRAALAAIGNKSAIWSPTTLTVGLGLSFQFHLRFPAEQGRGIRPSLQRGSLLYSLLALLLICGYFEIANDLIT